MNTNTEYTIENMPSIPPTYSNGVYSTIADEEFQKTLPVLDCCIEELPERPAISKNNSIGEKVQRMFDRLSSPSDTKCYSHKNGFANLLWSSSFHSYRNGEIKGNDEEFQLAQLEYRWDKTAQRTEGIYFGIQLNMNSKK